MTYLASATEFVENASYAAGIALAYALCVGPLLVGIVTLRRAWMNRRRAQNPRSWRRSLAGGLVLVGIGVLVGTRLIIVALN